MNLKLYIQKKKGCERNLCHQAVPHISLTFVGVFVCTSVRTTSKLFVSSYERVCKRYERARSYIESKKAGLLDSNARRMDSRACTNRRDSADAVPTITNTKSALGGPNHRPTQMTAKSRNRTRPKSSRFLSLLCRTVATLNCIDQNER